MWGRYLRGSFGPCLTPSARVSGHVAHPNPRRGEGLGQKHAPEQKESNQADPVLLIQPPTSTFASTRPGPERL